MAAFIDKGGKPVEVYPGIPFVDRGNIQRPGNWLDLATAAELSAAGVRTDWPFEPPDPPAGKVNRVMGIEVVSGEVRRTYVVEDASAPPADPLPETISDRQFAQALAKLDPPVITQAEALAFVKRGEVPAALQAVIDAVEDPEQRFDLDMAVSGATTFDRSNPSTEALAAAMGWSAAQMDGLWRFAATIR